MSFDNPPQLLNGCHGCRSGNPEMLNQQDQATRDLVSKASGVIARVRANYAAAQLARDLQEQIEEDDV